MNKHIFLIRFSFLLISLLISAGVLLSQVTQQELQQQNTNQPPATNVMPEGLLKVTPETYDDIMEAAKMGVLNEAGYFTIFTAIRNDAIGSDRYNISTDKQQQLDMVVGKMEQLYPQSFEYHYAAYLNARNDTAMGGHLLEAHRMAPFRTELYDDLVALAELSDNSTMKREFSQLLENRKVYDPLLYQYGRNMFRSLEKGAYIFTRGEWDTYPLWVLQSVHNENGDITVLQLDLLHKEHYFNRMMAPFKLKKGAYHRFIADKPAFFRELAAAKHGKPVYLSLTVDQQIISNIAPLLYNTGLAMKLSSAPFDNLTTLKANWNSFDLPDFSAPSGNQDLNRMTGNYIMPMGLMYRKAIAMGDSAEAEKIKEKMLNLAKSAGKLNEMEKFFNMKN